MHGIDVRNSYPERRRAAADSMMGYVTYAAGAPCPTLVLDARYLPRRQASLVAALTEIREWLSGVGGGHVLKIALVEPSPNPHADLDYRFIQALPDGPASFDLRGSCGHSMLGAAMASAEFGMLPWLAAGQRIRVNVLNNGDSVVCEVEQASQDEALFSVRFRYAPPRAADRLLLTGEPRTTLDVDGQRLAVSLVSTGNPYAFVAATSIGAASAEELFAGGEELLGRLVRVRQAAATLLGWPPQGAFPKVAATLPAGPNGIAVRAVSVPSWHPTLALTGSVCLAAATRIPHTVPWLAARAGGDLGAATDLHTPGGRWPVAVATVTQGGTPGLASVTVGHRQVTCYGSLRIQLPVHLQRKEIIECLSLTA